MLHIVPSICLSVRLQQKGILELSQKLGTATEMAHSPLF